MSKLLLALAIVLTGSLAVACGGTQAAAPAASGSPPASEDVKSPEFRTWTQEEASAALDSGQSLFAVMSSTYCGACPYLEERVDGMIREGQLPEVALFKDFEDDWYDERVQHVAGWPSLLYFKNGRIVDVSIGQLSEEELQRFVTRNQSPNSELELRAPEVGDDFRTRLRSRGYQANQDLRGQDLSAMVLSLKDFSGSDLREVDFSQASLSKVSFSRANLTDANFDDAKLADVFWGSCICPDGTRSEEAGYTCEGHLGAEVSHLEHTPQDLARACYESWMARAELDEDGEPTEQYKREMSLACSTTQRSGVLFADEFTPLDKDEAIALLEGEEQGLNPDRARASCQDFRYLQALPGQEDAMDGILTMQCDEIGPFLEFIGD